MLPPFVSEDTQSRAERTLFVELRDHLSNDWTVLHSLGVAEHRRKPWAEIDFVLVGPPGVFCLEVKGGRVTRRDGMWSFTDGADRESLKAEGPFEQVGSVAPQLYRHLREHDATLNQVLLGHGVVIPDVEFKIVAPDVEPAVLYDRRDSSRPFSEYLARLAEYWQERYPGRPPTTQAIRSRIVDLLRPDFDLRPSLGARLGHINRELLSLTTEQYRVLDQLIDAPRVIVRGGAGTGKTLLAREEARRQASLGRRVLLCCYNAVLGETIREELADVPGVHVTHLHRLLADLVAEAGLQGELPDVDGPRLFSVFYPAVALDAILALDRVGEFDVLLVDEAQDLLLDSYVDVFDALLEGGLKDGWWRIFLDPRQDVYRAQNGNSWERLATGVPFRLTVNCRNTEPIAVASALLGGGRPSEVLRAQGPQVDEIWYRDAAQQQRELGRLLGRLLGAEGVPAEQIVVLTRRRLENSSLPASLPGCPLPLVPLGPTSRRCIRHSTIASFKGLEADVVVLAELDDLLSDEAGLLNYVAASRARGHLVLLLDERRRGDYGVLGGRLGEALRVGGRPATFR